ncbi:hypothetical protein KBD33_00200 [Candidatus Gracilibacteria bacterium]|nr:hypothetical protein [Candidatus Gracilibacteria bacterium]
MISLTKITKYISYFKNRDFRKQIEDEKKQKYLFREEGEKSSLKNRNPFLMWKKKKILPYTNFFSQGVSYVDNLFWESKALSYIGGVLLFLSSYIIFFSPYFQVSPSNVIIESINPGIDLNIAYRSIENIYGKSLFLLNEEQTALNIKNSLKNVSHIRIEKLYPSGLKILITGSPILYKTTIIGFNKVWGLSENGVLIPNIVSGSGTDYKNLEITSEALKGEIFLDYKQIIDDTTMKSIQKVVELFRTEFANLTIAKIRYFIQEDEVHVLFENGGIIILSIQNNKQGEADNRLENLSASFIGLLRYHEDHDTELIAGSIHYIDARIPRKLFICRDKILCQSNLISVYGTTYSNQ